MSHPPESLRKALRELAEADAAEVVSEARERARARAAKLIENELVDELLEAATRLQSGGSSRSVGDGRSPAGVSWWAYCVLPAPEAGSVPSEIEGIEPGSSVELVCEGAVAALVSAVPAEEYDDVRLREHLEDLAWVERTARRHEAVLEATLGRVAIVPLRLCTLYRDLDGIRRMLRDYAAALRESLAKVEGCNEWGVKVFAASVEVDDDQRSSEPESAGDRPGSTYLIQRQRERERAERAAEIRSRCAEAVHERISACARESISNPPQHPELHGRKLTMLLNGAYLVADDRAADLHEAVRALQGEWEPRGFVIELTGPWPAYNFVSGVMP